MAHVAIQVVTYFGSGDLPALLASLQAQTYTDWELFVHDNACDATESARIGAMLAASGVRYRLTVGDKNEGFSSHNALWQSQTSPFVLLLNQDAVLDAAYLERVLAVMEADAECAAVAGLVLRWDGGAFPTRAEATVDTAGLEYHAFSAIHDRWAGLQIPLLEERLGEVTRRPAPVFGVSGAVAFYRRSAVEAVAVEPGELFVPGFFMYREDVELAMRLHRAGFVTMFVPDAIAYHRRALKDGITSWWKRLQDERRRSATVRRTSFRNEGWVVALHASTALPWRVVRRSVHTELLRATMVFLSSPAVFFRALAEMVVGLPRMWRRRREMAKRWPPFAGYRTGTPPPLAPPQGGGSMPKIGIIYLTYPTANWERDINRCLTSMEKLNYPKDRLELICVESKGKLPPIQPWFEATWMPKSGKELPRIHYIFRDEWIGFSGNNNLGLVKAKELGCDYVHLTNEDTDVDPDYLTHAVASAEADATVGIVQSLVLLGEDRERVNTIGNAYHILGHGYSNGYLWTKRQALGWLAQERVRNPALEISYASGAGMLVRVAALEGKTLFDEKFFSYHEDTDIALRLRMRGWKTVVEPRSILWHYYEFGKSRINYYWMERNRCVLPLTYYHWPTLLLLSPLFLAMDLATLLFSWRGGWLDMKWKVYQDFGTKAFWQWVWARRREVQKTRTISDRVFLKRAVSAIQFQAEGVKNPVLTYIGNPVMRLWWAMVRVVMLW